MFSRFISILPKFSKKILTKSNIISNQKVFSVQSFRSTLKTQQLSHNQKFSKILSGALLLGGLITFYKPNEISCKSLEEIEAKLQKVINEQGEESEEAMKLYYELGFFYMHKGQKEESLETFRRYLKTMKKKFGTESGEFSQALVQVASVFTFFSNFPFAIESLREALQIQKKLYGEQNKHVAQCYMNLGVVFSLVREYDAAVDQLRKAYFLFRNVEPESSHLIGLSLSTLARTLKLAGKREEALNAYEALHELQLKQVGKNYPESQVVQSAISELKSQLKPNVLN